MPSHCTSCQGVIDHDCNAAGVCCVSRQATVIHVAIAGGGFAQHRQPQTEPFLQSVEQQLNLKTLQFGTQSGTLAI
ncbi:hypothetical protein CCH79_00014562 [Gambusia affinis]|uniref:Uncharacterized protein n=1 Tax=Gambusia affinis TaxID=33528 RepID=A0A315V7A6_GAMAF|nr:hypothetical protein CCH79_00014562 [Gambusia affinis]